VSFPRVFELLAATWPESLPAAGSKGPGTIRPREVPPRSLHLNYRNDCVIISRALISSPQGGCMVHAARASTASAPAPLSARHFLIASRQILKIGLTRSQSMRKHFLIASFSAISAPARRGGPVPHLTHHSPLITHHRSTAFLFDTNKARKIIILVRALLKTKEKQFSIQYKFASRDNASLALVRERKNVPHLQRARNAACLAVLVVLSCPAASGPNWFACLGMGA
jgi:hypothetical protein